MLMFFKHVALGRQFRVWGKIYTKLDSHTAVRGSIPVPMKPNLTVDTLRGRLPKKRFVVPEAVIDRVQLLLDEVVHTSVDEPSDERFVICDACGEVDSHSKDCFVPALDRWMAGGD